MSNYVISPVLLPNLLTLCTVASGEGSVPGNDLVRVSIAALLYYMQWQQMVHYSLAQLGRAP